MVYASFVFSESDIANKSKTKTDKVTLLKDGPSHNYIVSVAHL